MLGNRNFYALTIYILFCYVVIAQFDHCLWPSGCHGDECCFNVVSKTGPICDPIPGCAAAFKPDCCRNARPIYTDYGIMYGYAILLDDAYSYRDNGRRYLEVWRGVPYARPPTRENNLRFRRPVNPVRSNDKYDATYFRDACSQPTAGKDGSFATWASSPYEWMKRLPIRQTADQREAISEDCLYMNIYTLNETYYGGASSYPGLRRKLPIMVFFDGADHLTGTANRYPGHALAQLGLMVVFVNYRLGPMGFLCTESNPTIGVHTDDSADKALGNYGLWDQIRALEFIRENADKFLGDPDQITVVGHGSGAADVALHLLSKYSGRRVPPLFHRAVLMSGSDKMEGGFVREPAESKIYAMELAHQVGCDVSPERQMLDCLRARTAMELSNAAGQTRIHRPDWLTKPWAPTMDGDFIEGRPDTLWNKRKFAHLPLLGGLTVDDGALHAIASIFQLPNKTITASFRSSIPNPDHIELPTNSNFAGMSEDLAKSAFYRMVRNDFALDPISLSDALSFEYTDWANRSDQFRRWNMYRGAWTDRLIGSGLVQTLRSHSLGNQTSVSPNRTQMYVFAYKNSTSVWTRLLGSYGGSELPYLFGLPRLALFKSQEEIAQEWPLDLDIYPPDTTYTKLERNITDYMLYFISSFVKSGNATPVPIRNLTWDTYRPENRTYLWINLTWGYNFSRSHQPEMEYLGLGAGFDLRQNYRVYRHAFWNHLYPKELRWQPRFTPPTPTPAYLEDYRTSALSLIGIFMLLCILIVAVLIVYCRRKRLLQGHR